MSRKHRLNLLVVSILPAFVATASYACIKPAMIKSVLDISQAACVLVNERVDDEHELAKVCDIADDLLPEVRKLVSARKAAAVQKASMSQSPTASAPAKSSK